jgi:FkbM family methyltransferase
MTLPDNYPIYFRPGTSDIPVFREIFFEFGYDFNFKGLDIKTMIDAGANIGMVSIFMKRKFPSAKIVAIEPAENNFEQLKKNTQLLKDIHYENKGVWDKEAYLKVHISETKGGEWGIYVTEVEQTEKFDIMGVSIQSLMDKYDIHEIDFLKIDIEGAEKQIFTHDKCVWLENCKIIAVELHDRTTSGCSMALFKKLNELIEYDMEVHGECVVIYNKKYFN